MKTRSESTPHGFAIVVLMFALVMIVLCSSLLVAHVLLRYDRATNARNRAFALNAARSILAECHAWAVAGRDMEDLDDGGVAKSQLGLAPQRETDGERADGNFKRGGDWIWWREIRVRPLVGVDNRAMRVVTVGISKRAADGTRKDITSLSTLVAARNTGYPTTQIVDLYLLAIENIAARGVRMDAMRPFVESVVADLERANPGLTLRTHWITKAGYGRDRHYSPDVSSGTSRRAYRYPTTAAEGAYAYDADRIRGRIHVDGVLRNRRDPNDNPQPYALADRFNHGMRLPAERAFHAARIRKIRERKRAIATARDRDAPVPANLADMSEEPTLRLFLEDLNTHPDKYRDALILNLHGDVIPMPAIRNYSDAASDPVTLPHLRCVTHPEELRTRRDPKGQTHDPVVFRVYAYSDDPSQIPSGGRCPEGHAIALRVMGIDLTDPDRDGVLRSDVELESLDGGLDHDYWPFERAKSARSARGRNGMFYTARFVDPGFGEEKYTLIQLHHTPVTCPLRQDSGRGLAADAESRLYGLEYVPGPTGPKRDFSHDLSSAGSGPKNTARWRLKILGTVFRDRRFVNVSGEYHDPKRDVCLAVETSFVSPGGSKTSRPSMTYSWWAANADAVPATEQSQFLGDPRHCPYKDVATGDPDFGDGYNWYFDSLRGDGDGAVGHAALDPDRLADGWLGGHRFDAPRYLALLRRGLLRSRASFATVGSFGDTRVLIGGETGDREQDLVRQNAEVDYWWCRPWMGELCPDSAYARSWSGRGAGNLPRGDGPLAFTVADAATVHAGSGWRRGTGASFTSDSTLGWNWQSFFNAEIADRALGIVAEAGSAALTSAGSALQARFRTRLPATIGIGGRLAWVAGGGAPEWEHPAYAIGRCRARIARSYWDVTDVLAHAAAIVELTDARHRARIAVNCSDGHDVGLRVRHALLMLLDGHLSGGRGVPPRLRLLEPTETATLVDPPSLRVQWEIDLAGGAAPTAETISEIADETNLHYSLIYSRDDGRTWRHLGDHSFAEPGVRPFGELCRVDAGAGPESFRREMPAAEFPAGAYLLRVELFVGDRRLHSAHHTRRIVVVR